jgi:hypothetical protein
MFVFHVCQPSYLCNVAIQCTSYWQLELSNICAYIQIYLHPSLLEKEPCWACIPILACIILGHNQRRNHKTKQFYWSRASNWKQGVSSWSKSNVRQIGSDVLGHCLPKKCCWSYLKKAFPRVWDSTLESLGPMVSQKPKFDKNMTWYLSCT